MDNAHNGIALVGFDADDTLWKSQDYFDAAQAEFERIVAAYVDLAVRYRDRGYSDADVRKELAANELPMTPALPGKAIEETFTFYFRPGDPLETNTAVADAA